MTSRRTKHSAETIRRAVALRLAGHTLREVVEATGVPYATLYWHASRADCGQTDGAPSPAEIAERAAAIRRHWTPDEFARRAGVRRDAVMTVPTVTCHTREALR